MTSPTLPLPADAASARSSEDRIANTGGRADSFDLLLAQTRSALAAFAAEPRPAVCPAGLLDALRAVREATAALSSKQVEGPLGAKVVELLRTVWSSGVHDLPLGEADLARADACAKRGPAGLLAAILLVPGWQWANAPALADVPNALWGDCAAWLFSPPALMEVGDQDRYAAYLLRRLQELLSWVERNAGSAAVRSALDAYVPRASLAPIHSCDLDLRRHAELRARLLARAFGAHRSAYEPAADSRLGRRLRIGILARDFDAGAATFCTLAYFGQLDPDRFEVVLFAGRSFEANGTEEYCRRRAAEFHALSGALAERLTALREARLDVLVFGSDLTAECDDVVQLALHRIAPLQVATSLTRLTSAFPQIDLHVTGDFAATSDHAVEFTERLGVMPGPSVVFHFDAEGKTTGDPWTRAMLGLSDDALVFVSAAHHTGITPEVQRAWTQLLAAVPGAHLLLHPLAPNEAATAEVEQLCHRFDRRLKAAGVEAGRLQVSTLCLSSRAAVKELLRLGDVYLDTPVAGDPSALSLALDLGLPPVVQRGATLRSRHSAALLRSVALEGHGAATGDEYRQKAIELAGDRAGREQLRGKIQNLIPRLPRHLDALAASDAFGELMLGAYDLVAPTGRAAFGADRSAVACILTEAPGAILATSRSFLEIGLIEDARRQVALVLGAAPASPAARHAMAEILMVAGQPRRAADYLLAAVQGEDSPVFWRDLINALTQAGCRENAILALKTWMRIAPGEVEPWFTIGQTAADHGHLEILQGTVEILKELAPHDPRLGSLEAAAA